MPNAPGNSTSARDAALEMRRRHGWFVFPAHPREKRPFGDFRWLPYGDQLPSLDTISSWPQWDGRGCRVAVRTGAVSGIIVLDCDSEDAREFVKRMGHPPTPMARTGREGTGLHIYLRHPGKRVKNATHFRGIDRLDVRGDGGIVLAPPSLHESGKRYEWIISPEESELADCPQWLLDMFDEADEGREPMDIQETFSGISEGKRDETLFRLAAKMRYHDFPVEVTMTAIEEAAKRMQPPFPAKDARAKVTWTYTNYEPGEDGAMLKVEEIIEQQAEAAEGFKTQTLSDLMKKKFPPVKWVIPGILPEGSMLFAGKPKTGKSFFVLSLCLAVTTGIKALGRFKVEQGPVLYLALEDPERRLQKRAIEALGGRKGSELFHFVTQAGQIDTTLLGELEIWLKENRDARLVAIDTLAKVQSRKSAKNQNLYVADYQTVEGLTALASKYNVAILIVTHTNQMREASDPWDMIQGSTGLTGGVNGAMVLTHGRGEAEGFIKAAHHDLEEVVDIALQREENGLWTYIGDAEKYRMTKERREILDYITAADEAKLPSEVAKDMGKNVSTVNKLMRKMMNEGDLVQERYGRYKPSLLAPPGMERLKTDPDPNDTITF